MQYKHTIKKLNVVKTHHNLTETEIKNKISEIQTKLNKSSYNPYIQWKLSTKKEANFLLSKMYIEDIPHFHKIWKIL